MNWKKTWFVIRYYSAYYLSTPFVEGLSLLNRPKFFMLVFFFLSIYYYIMKNYALLGVTVIATIIFMVWNRVIKGDHNIAYKEWERKRLTKKFSDKKD